MSGSVIEKTAACWVRLPSQQLSLLMRRYCDRALKLTPDLFMYMRETFFKYVFDMLIREGIVNHLSLFMVLYKIG